MKPWRAAIDMVQLRDKELPAGDLLELAVAMKDTINGRALFLVNDRADVALAAGADGVQLGERALPPAAARRIVGPDCLIGRSVHSPGRERPLPKPKERRLSWLWAPCFPPASHPGVCTCRAGPC